MLDDFRLEQSADGFGQGVVAAVPDASSFGEPLDVSDGELLHAAVRVAGQSAQRRTPLADGLVEGVGLELAVDLVFGAWPGRVGDRGRLSSSRDLLQSSLPHEPLHGASGDPAVLPPQLSPDLARSVPPSAFIVDAPDHLDGFGVLFGPVGRFSGVAGDGGMRIIGRRSDQQNAADRLDAAAS